MWSSFPDWITFCTIRSGSFTWITLSWTLNTSSCSIFKSTSFTWTFWWWCSEIRTFDTMICFLYAWITLVFTFKRICNNIWGFNFSFPFFSCLLAITKPSWFGILIMTRSYSTCRSRNCAGTSSTISTGFIGS